MKKIRDIIISVEEPVDNSVGWLLPVGDGTFKFKVYSFNGWTDIALGTQDTKGPTDAEGNITGGTATLSDKSIIPITVTQK